MSFDIIPILPFQRQAKRLIKKFPSLKDEIVELIKSLGEDAQQGTPLGNDCFKIRLSIVSKNKGKSGGARVITYFISDNNELYLLSIYDKSNQASLSDKELKELIKLVSQLKKNTL